MGHAEQDEQKHKEAQEVADKDMDLFDALTKSCLGNIEIDISRLYVIGTNFKSIDTDAIIKERVMEMLS